MKIKNIDDLRDNVIETLEKLSAGKIDVHQALASSKLTDSVLQTVKTQLEYAKMTETGVDIPFMRLAKGVTYESKSVKYLPKK